MSHKFYIAQTNKKRKSTKRSFNSYGVINVVFKEGSDLINPTILLNLGYGLDYYNNKNYMVWEMDVNTKFYYWITGVKAVHNGIYEISLELDHLATYRTDIGNYYAFVTRCSDPNKYNIFDNDNIISPTNKISQVFRAKVDTYFKYNNRYADDHGEFDGGPTVFTVYGKDGVHYYLSLRNPQDISNDLMDENDLWDTFDNALSDPAKYIKSMMMMPITDLTNYSSGAVQTVKVGNISRPVRSTVAVNNANRYWNKDFRINIWTNNLLFGTYSNYYKDYRLYNNNFTQVQLLVPFVGVINCPQETLSYQFIRVYYAIDIITGTGECVVCASNTSGDVPLNLTNDFIINRSSVQIGANVPFATSNSNVTAVMKNLLNPVSLMGALVNERQNLNMIGQTDGLGYIDISQIICKVNIFESDNLDYISEKGFPTNKYFEIDSVDISQDPVYIECLNPSIKIEGCQQEIIDRINNDLANGFYFE